MREPMMVRSPGRINLIGEHTDYNDGFVMPAAIDKEIIFAMAPSPEGVSQIHSLNFSETVTVDLNNPDRVNHPAWLNYLLGVIRSLKDGGHNISPFVCTVGGNIPVGAGLSSSAAFECGFAFALNEMNGLGLSRQELIKTAQWAEHNYAGVKCGIMDQFASMMGREGFVFVLDCRDLSYEYFPLRFPGYDIVLVDSRVKHSLAGSEYNTRRAECEAGVSELKKHYPDVASLRDVTLQMLEGHHSTLKGKIFDRCRYVVEENHRVQAAGHDLREGNLAEFGKKMYQTHHGLSRLYEVSCAELDFLVDQAQNLDIPGSRMMGGGFGGCTINIVPRERKDIFAAKIGESYQRQFSIAPLFYTVNIMDGTGILRS